MHFLSIQLLRSADISWSYTDIDIYCGYLYFAIQGSYRKVSIFFIDIDETLPIYYFMDLEYMCEGSKLFTIGNPRKLLLNKN